MKYKTWSIENGGKYKISELKIGDRIMVNLGYHTYERWEPAVIVSFDSGIDLWTNDPKVGVTVRLLSGELMPVANYLFEQPNI
jgi:hypothetical protein